MTWRGTVRVEEDLLVPAGRTLRIRAGTRVVVRPADTSRTEPEFIDNRTEILVRGELVVEGSAREPVTFSAAPGAPPGEPGWAGIIFDGGGGRVRHVRITGAECGVRLLAASPRLEAVVIEEVTHGVSLHGASAPRLEGVRIDAAEGALYCWPGSAPAIVRCRGRAGEREGLFAAPGARPRITASTFSGPLGGVLWAAGGEPPRSELPGTTIVVAPPPPDGTAAPAPTAPRPAPAAVAGGDRPARVYRGESFIGADETWRGTVLVDGTVMVSPAAVLTVEPGTTVRFTFRDTNGDGVGENELFVQGRIVAAGERERPIVFMAAGERGPGRWGAVNLMGSDAEENRFAFCVFESAYRGLHSHFSAFRLEDSLFTGNMRAVQFQESRAVISGCTVTGNGSAMRFRDSTVTLERCRLAGNVSGLQVLRSQVAVVDTTVEGHLLAGMHLREATGAVEGCLVRGNNPGIRLSESRLRLVENRIEGNDFGGLLMRRSEGEVARNRVTGNRGNGVLLDGAGVRLRGNDLSGNVRFAIESDSPEPVDARENYWGVPPGGIPALVFDGADDSALAPVLTEPPAASPPGAGG